MQVLFLGSSFDFGSIVFPNTTIDSVPSTILCMDTTIDSTIITIDHVPSLSVRLPDTIDSTDTTIDSLLITIDRVPGVSVRLLGTIDSLIITIDSVPGVIVCVFRDRLISISIV